MFETLEKLCNTDGISGDEQSVRERIIAMIDGICDWKVDNLGNIIAFKEGKKRAVKKVMIDAHTDEVGLIITNITDKGYLKFTTVGGIETSALMFRKVKLQSGVIGVISGKPIHLLSSDEAKKLPKTESLYIDIGAKSKDEALKYVSVGDSAVMCGSFEQSGECVISKALDDRVGCAVLVELLKNESEYDFYASFSVQEEIGLRGAKVSAYSINPDCAIVIDGTTASDLSGVSEDKKVCSLGKGAVVSFMDKATSYDKEFFNKAMNSGINCQPKSAVTGGNNAGAVHLSRNGVRTIAISVPCRYIHSSSSVANKTDIKDTYALVKYMLCGIASGEIK